ncbi:MAG: DUF3179 domain-containing protein [Deltaproteobacteria bacterium]|nr:DUF3179 domain-containing protein [Deltaproteobacteria bacterium]
MVKKGILTVIVITFFFLFATMVSRAKVIQDGDKSYIVDMTGERWDVTQAVSLGFDPSGFQYGIGKNAFTPLDDSHLAEGDENVPGYVRVIGVDDGKSGKAYSVGRLSRHEIANSERGSEKVAVAY